jgi:hypothetical protein
MVPPPGANDYSSSAPSEGSSAASTFESRLMLMAWISAIRICDHSWCRLRTTFSASGESIVICVDGA